MASEIGNRKTAQMRPFRDYCAKNFEFASDPGQLSFIALRLRGQNPTRDTERPTFNRRTACLMLNSVGFPRKIWPPRRSKSRCSGYRPKRHPAWVQMNRGNCGSGKPEPFVSFIFAMAARFEQTTMQDRKTSPDTSRPGGTDAAAGTLAISQQGPVWERSFIYG